MSGTSLDGLDLAYCSITAREQVAWEFEILSADTIPYSKEWRLRLREAIHDSEEKLQELDQDYTRYLAQQIQEFISQKDIEDLDAVCSHGHTILHQPHRGVTMQIGNQPELAKLLQQTVVCDFRVQDVALGGQGAPLVPMGDRLLFGEYDYCLNLGGFSNISKEEQGRRMAYDICPVNIVLNYLAEKRGASYDAEGQWAAQGQLIPGLLEQLNQLEFYKQPPPKSLGLEWVNQYIFPLFSEEFYRVEDLLHTYTEHIAIQLAAHVEEGRQVLVTGGGAYNTYLLQRIQSYKKVRLVVPEKKIVDYKEALVFGLLGLLRLLGKPNCLSSVTGASHDHSSGFIYLSPI